MATEGIIRKLLAGHPLVLVDAGSTGGIEPRWWWLDGLLRVVTFEPDARGYATLPASLEIMNFPCALGDQQRDVELLLTAFPPASSIFEPDMAALSPFPNRDDHITIGKRRITLRTLSGVLDEAGIHEVDFIKLDTQGADLFVLKGGEEFLRSSVFGIQIEVEFNPTYKGRPPFGEIDEYIRSFGFVLFDLRREFWKRDQPVAARQIKGQLIWADALYLRTASSFLDLCRRAEAGEAEVRVAKAVVIAVLFGYYDYAAELCRRARDANLISGALGYEIEKRIRRCGTWRFRLPPALHPTIFGKAHRLTARLVWMFYQRIRPHWREFAITDPE